MSSSTTERHPDGQITTEQRGNIYLIGIDRPEKYNGFTPKMFTELADAYAELEHNDELWVGVLHAHGKNFTAGLDLPKFADAMKTGAPILPTNGVDPFSLKPPFRTTPVIAAMKGICYTAAIELMLATEIVVSSESARYSQLEVGRGVMAAAGATFRMIERAGWGNAMKVLLTGYEFNAEEALRYNFIQEIVPDGEELNRALELAEEIARQAPLAVRATVKSSRTYCFDGPQATVADFTPIMQELANTKDAAEGVQSFIEKRPPVYMGK
ncbi:MAG: crotonase/enoyl-CoA hydratase family protein [Porticoccaceae bacterium]|nr:crotonase/enoyl-CoA hydratase family protein [Porticoccaceae bacterium]